MSTQATKLVYARPPPDVYVISYLDVPSQSGVTAHDQMVSDFTVVSDVTVGKKDVVGADASGIIGLGGDVSRNVLAKDVVVPDLKSGFPAFVFQIMRQAADHGVGKDGV